MTIMVPILISCLLLMGFMMMIPAKPHNNVLLENTLPKDKLQDSQVKQLAKTYRIRIMQIMFGSCLLSLLLIYIPYDSLYFSLFFLLLFGSIGGCYFCQIHFIRKLRILIITNEWQLPIEPVLVDTTLIQQKNRKMVPFAWLLGSLILTIVILVYSAIKGASLISLTSVMALFLWGMFATSYYFIRRFPVKSWSNEVQLNQQYNDLTKYYWSLTIVGMSYMFTPLLILPMVVGDAAPKTSYQITGAIFALTVLGLVFSLYCLFKLRSKQDQLINLADKQRYTGEDEFWRYGFYYNPDDRRLMLPDRIGLNITMNFARPAIKVITLLTGLLLVGVMFITIIPTYSYDFNPRAVQLKINETSITLSAPMVKTSNVNLSDIQKVELLDQMPKQATRVFGLGSDNYLMGDFQVGLKKATVYVNLNQKQILHIITENEDYYFTGNRTKPTSEYFSSIKTLI